MIRPHGNLFFCCFFILLFSISLSFQFAMAEDQAVVNKAIDGDTLLLNNGEKVRLIGVDTPELYHPLKPVQYFAKEASLFTKNLVEGKEVKLEYDWQKRDKYNRLLAYVYLKDGTFINAEIIKQGYGFAYIKYPFKYLEQFKTYEKEAREKGLGLWKDSGEGELKWVTQKGEQPFLIYALENDMWAIKYINYAKIKISSEVVMPILASLKIWVNELSPKDLKKQLVGLGWKQINY